MTDIITLGEVLIDMTQCGRDGNGNAMFAAYPGGAPANVAVAAARLGASTGFIGKVGDDAFGRSLEQTLKNEGVGVAGLYTCSDVPTTMALVSIDETGDRDFSFYRDPGADTQLTSGEALEALGKDLPKVLHVGSLSMTTEPSREACLRAVAFAREKGILISYDPNYRSALWKSGEIAVKMMKSLLPMADILKVSEEEMLMLTGSADLEEGSRILSDSGPSLVMVTLGPKGVFARCGDSTVSVPPYDVVVADTNGAGDTFLGAMLMQITREDSEAEDTVREGEGSAVSLDRGTLLRMVTWANKAAALTCSRHGAIPAMPYRNELE